MLDFQTGSEPNRRYRPRQQWIYNNENGNPYLRVERIERDGSKIYPQAHWNGNGWEKGKPKGPKIPYRLPELVNAPGQPVFICEGEKCADAVAELGWLATSASEGAGKWTPDLNKWFEGRVVFILPDNDEPGDKHAHKVASNLYGIAREIRIVELEGLEQGEDVFDWIERGPFPDNLLRIAEEAPLWKPEPTAEADLASPGDADPPLRSYAPRPFEQIPRRRWLHAGHYIRGHVVMTVAPGGYGKTSLSLINSIEMALGRGLIGLDPNESPLRVAYWNAEDPDDEIERRVAAICLHNQIDPACLTNRLFIGSRLIDKRRIASVGRDGNVVFESGMIENIERTICDLKIDCITFDPLVAFHRVPESDTMGMEQVIKDGFGEIAARTNCCVELSQHTRKPSQGRTGDLTADDSRGAGAVVFAARSVRVLNRMTSEEAELPKIPPEERRSYLKVSKDKANMVAASEARWIRLVSVQLPNGDEFNRGDEVQAVEGWEYPKPFDVVTTDDMHWIRDRVRQDNTYRKDPRSPQWIGFALAERLGLNPDDDRKRINVILKNWFTNGVLAVKTRLDAERHEKAFVVPGPWKDPEESAAVADSD